MKNRRSRFVKLVALIVAFAMVVVLAISLFSVLGSSVSVAGTYKASDGRVMVLDKNKNATLSVPSISTPMTTTYKVQDNAVWIVDPSDQSKGLKLDIDGKDLVSVNSSSGNEDRWVRQK